MFNKRQRGGRGGARHPPGLSGKEIGLWYARRGRARKLKEQSYMPALHMNEAQAQDVEKLVSSLSGNEGGFSTKRACSDGLKYGLKQGDNFDGGGSSVHGNLDYMQESDFKRAYIANIYGNMLADGRISNDTTGNLFEKCPTKDKLYQGELENKAKDIRYQNMMKFRKKLPSYSKREEILNLVRNNQAVVISGETGCGKTTQVAQFILDDAILSGNGSTCHIVCTQPRRISAISVAERVAAERAERLGFSVGYQIRLENTLPRSSGSILFCTTGIILQWLQSDRKLSQVSHLILDEIHERDINSDFLICIARDIMKTRPDIKIVLMSATLNAEKFSAYYGNCPSLNIPGFTFPVTEFYLEDVLEKVGFEFPHVKQKWKRKVDYGEVDDFYDIGPYLRDIEAKGRYSPFVIEQLSKPSSEMLDMRFVLEVLRYICFNRPAGAVLVFLPGMMQISDLNKFIEKDADFGSGDYLVLPLHSLMPTVDQRQVFDRPPPGVRKIILSTNIAETSITIDDIVYVVDCGRIKMTKFQKQSGFNTLLPEWETRANAKQRRGRAGRVQKGECYYLFSRFREMTFADYPLPEIQRSSLESLILHIKILELGSVKKILSKVMDSPDEEVVDFSIQLMETIRALDKEENLTPLGFHLAQLRIEPLIGRMLIMGAIFSCISPILTIAASLSFKDPFYRPLGKEKQVENIRKEFSCGTQSDHLALVEAFRGWEEAKHSGREHGFIYRNFLSLPVLNQLAKMRTQFFGLLKERNFVNSLNPEANIFNKNSDNVALVKAVVTSGMYPKVVKVCPRFNRRPPILLARNSKPVVLHPNSINVYDPQLEGPWLVYNEMIQSSKVFIHDSSSVRNYPLLFFGENISYNDKTKTIDVDSFVKVHCSLEIANLIKKLRMELDDLLQYKINHPGVTLWERHSNEGKLLHTIVDLITNERRPERRSFDSVEEISSYPERDLQKRTWLTMLCLISLLQVCGRHSNQPTIQ